MVLLVLSACNRGSWTNGGKTIVGSLFPPGSNPSTLGPDQGIALSNAFNASSLAGINQVTGIPGIGPDGQPNTPPTNNSPITLPSSLEDDVRRAILEMRDGSDPAAAAAQLYNLMPQLVSACNQQLSGPEFLYKAGDTLHGNYHYVCGCDAPIDQDRGIGYCTSHPEASKVTLFRPGLTAGAGTVNASGNAQGQVSMPSETQTVILKDEFNKNGTASGYNTAGNCQSNCTLTQTQSFKVAKVKHDNSTGKMAGCLNLVTSLVTPSMTRVLARGDQSSVNAIIERLLGFRL